MIETSERHEQAADSRSSPRRSSADWRSDVRQRSPVLLGRVDAERDGPIGEREALGGVPVSARPDGRDVHQDGVHR